MTEDPAPRLRLAPSRHRTRDDDSVIEDFPPLVRAAMTTFTVIVVLLAGAFIALYVLAHFGCAFPGAC